MLEHIVSEPPLFSKVHIEKLMEKNYRIILIFSKDFSIFQNFFAFFHKFIKDCTSRKSGPGTSRFWNNH